MEKYNFRKEVANKTYLYKGPIIVFGKCLGIFSAKTIAVSKEKACCNFKFQAKTKMNLLPSAKIDIDQDKIKEDIL